MDNTMNDMYDSIVDDFGNEIVFPFGGWIYSTATFGGFGVDMRYPVEHVQEL